MPNQITSCQIPVSTIFVFDTQSQQTAANSIYVNKKDEIASSINGVLAPGKNHDVKLIFKSDYERMQYVMGLFGRSSQGRR
jgi:hypothetical protein